MLPHQTTGKDVFDEATLLVFPLVKSIARALWAFVEGRFKDLEKWRSL